MEAVGEQPLPGVGGVASVEAEATLPTWPWARLALWNGWPIRGHHVISKPSQNSGPVMALIPATLSPDPNGRPHELNCSIKVGSSKILEDSSVQTFSELTCLDSGGCNSSTRKCSVWRPSNTSTNSQIYILEKSLARLNLPMLLLRGMMTKFKLTNIFGEPNDYILEGKADVKNEDDWS